MYKLIATKTGKIDKQLKTVGECGIFFVNQEIRKSKIH